MKTKPRIILFAPSLNTGGGTERVLVNLANELIGKGYDVVIAINVMGDAMYYQLSALVSIKQYWFSKIRSKYPKSVPLKFINKLFGTNFLEIFLKNIVKGEKVIIISFSNGITIDCFNTSFGENIIAFEHWPYWVSDKNIKLQKKINRIYPQLKRVIVLTEHEKSVYNNIGCNNVKIIPNAYSFLADNPAKLDKKIVLSIGHFNEQKRRDLLVKAWMNVCKKHPDWKLVIVGDGPQKKEVLVQIKELGLNDFVEIIEPTNQIMEQYLNSSIYLMSSEYEALPMVLIEAKTCGIPCVSFDIVSGPREIIQDQKDGFLVTFPDTDLMAEKINFLIENPTVRKEFGSQARLDALNRFNPIYIYECWDDMLLNI